MTLDEELDKIAEDALKPSVYSMKHRVMRAMRAGVRAFAEQEPTEKMLMAAMLTTTEENGGIEMAPLHMFRAMMAEALKDLD